MYYFIRQYRELCRYIYARLLKESIVRRGVHLDLYILMALVSIITPECSQETRV